MARSMYVYVVMYGLSPVAGFTVKHELVRWLKHPHRKPEWYRVVRMRDGAGAGGGDWLDVKDLVND